MATDRSMVIRWRTDVATRSTVRFGDTPTALTQTQTTSPKTKEHEVTLSGLSAGTQYYYSVGTPAQIVAGGDESYRFKTSPPVGEAVPTRIWLIGDSGTANQDAADVYDAYMASPGAENTDVWIMLGDNAYPHGTDGQYQKAVFDMYPELLRRAPVWSTIGNHDGKTADSATESGPYYDIFNFPRDAEAGGLASGTEAYYSFDHGNIHFICLDSYETNRATDGAMLTWLQNDIAATSQPWIIGFFHHPPYTKGSHDSDTEIELTEMRENALPILESYGIDMVFTGHSHSYERSYLLNGHYGKSSTIKDQHKINDGDGQLGSNGAYRKVPDEGNGGAVYTVAGASGKLSKLNAKHRAIHTAFRQLGSVVLDVEGDSITARHLRQDGMVSDRYTITKKAVDNQGPTVVKAEITSSSIITIEFSEALDKAAASNKALYQLSEGNRIYGVSVKGHTVTLSAGRLNKSAANTLTIKPLKDAHGNLSEQMEVAVTVNNVTTEKFQYNNQPSKGFRSTQDTSVYSGSKGRRSRASPKLEVDADSDLGEKVTLLKWSFPLIDKPAIPLEAALSISITQASQSSYSVYLYPSSWEQLTSTWINTTPPARRGVRVAQFTIEAPNPAFCSAAKTAGGITKPWFFCPLVTTADVFTKWGRHKEEALEAAKQYISGFTPEVRAKICQIAKGS